MQTSVPLAFGDGEYIFALPIKQIVALEEKAGPIDTVRHRLLNGGFSVLDVTETIRHGLIGGGKGIVNGTETTVGPLKANILIDTYIDGQPLAEVAITARAAILALYFGYDPATETAQKKTEAEGGSQAASTGDSSSTTASPSG